MKMNQNFTAFIGATVRIQAVLTHDGEPFDLQGAVLQWLLECRRDPIEKTNADMEIDGHVVTFRLEPDETAALRPGSYYHEMVVIDGQGHKAPVLSGLVDMRRSAILSA